MEQYECWLARIVNDVQIFLLAISVEVLQLNVFKYLVSQDTGNQLSLVWFERVEPRLRCSENIL